MENLFDFVKNYNRESKNVTKSIIDSKLNSNEIRIQFTDYDDLIKQINNPMLYLKIASMNSHL